MSFVHYMITSSAFVIILSASAPMAQARITGDEGGSTAPKKILRITGTLNQDGALEVQSSRFLEPQKIEIENTTTTSTTSTISTNNPTPTLEENLAALLNAVSLNLPKVANIVEEAAAQPEGQTLFTLKKEVVAGQPEEKTLFTLKKELAAQPEAQQPTTLKSGFVGLGQELLGNPQVTQPLAGIFGPDLLNKWNSKLASSAQHDNERSFNFKSYGSYVTDRDLVKSAYFNPDQKLLKQATIDPVLYGKLMSKVARYPDMKEKIDRLR